MPSQGKTTDLQAAFDMVKASLREPGAGAAQACRVQVAFVQVAAVLLCSTVVTAARCALMQDSGEDEAAAAGCGMDGLEEELLEEELLEEEADETEAEAEDAPPEQVRQRACR